MVIKNKLTYLWVVAAIIIFIKLAFDITQNNYDKVLMLVMLEVMCIYCFIKLNSRSSYLNPDHPKK